MKTRVCRDPAKVPGLQPLANPPACPKGCPDVHCPRSAASLRWPLGVDVHLRDELAAAAPAKAAGRHAAPQQAPGAALAIRLQRAAGNAAVSGLLRASPAPGAGLLALQRCGPVPCDCAEEGGGGGHAAPAPAEGAEEARAAGA